MERRRAAIACLSPRYSERAAARLNSLENFRCLDS